MMKLMKYELLRRKQMFIGAALTILFVEGVTLLGIYLGGGWIGTGADGWNGWNVLAVVMTALLVVGVFVLTFLDAVTRLYSDYKQKHGYMLFMTPQSGYRIIWAKTIFAVLEVIAAGIVVAGCLALSCMALEQVYGAVTKFFADPPADINIIVSVGTSGIIAALLQIMAQLSIAILAVTVSRAMTRSNNYNWLIALVMYFALALIVNFADGALLVAFGVIQDIKLVDHGAPFFENGMYAKYIIIGAATYLVWFTGCTLLSGRLLKRGIDL